MNGGAVLAVQRGPATGLLAQVGVLGVLDASVGLGTLGWVVGISCGAVVTVVLGQGLVRHRVHRLGPADRVTLTRATLVCGVAALTADSFVGPAAVGALVTLAVVALVLDWVDGQVARRTGTTSRLGARFDMEVDAFLILVLSVYVERSAGAWVLLIGAARYALLAAGWVQPWLRRPAPPRYWAKVVAATQGVVLTLAAADLVPSRLTDAALIGAIGLLGESFGREVWWLHRHRIDQEPSGVRVRARAA
jgi:phosphatidylglycerophosphate synthase